MKQLVKRLAHAALGLVLALGGPALALADETATTDKQGVATLDSIVVTAGKRQESLQEVDASVSLITDEDVEVERIESVHDLEGRLANFHVQSAGGHTNSFISVRGVVGQTVPMTPSGVGVYLDDVTLIDPLSSLLSSAYFFDLDRIELLRGPQGTLYGRNAEAGVLVIKTKDPEHKLSGKVLGEVGNYDKYMGSAVINAPLIQDKLAVRLAASYLKQDGYHDNVYLGNTAADADEMNVRGKLLWDIGPATSALLTIENYHVRDGAQDMIPLAIAGPNWDSSKVNTDVDGHENRDMTAYSLRLNHQLDFADIVSITAFRDGKETTLGDPDFWSNRTGYADFELKQKQFTQELRLVSNDDSSPWKWLTGAYYFHNDLNFDSFYHIGPDGVEMEMDMITRGGGVNQGAALFGDVEYAFDSGWRLGGGVRGQYYKDEMDSTRYYELMGFKLDEQSGDVSSDYTHLMGKLKLAYDFACNLTVYGLVSQGSRAGGITSLAQTDKMHDYDPETATNYELGLKYQLPGGWGYVDLSMFYMDIQDLQVSTTGLGGFQYVSNAGKARNIGGELGLRLNLLPGLSADASIGYVDAVMTDYKDGDLDYADNTVPKVPDITGMIGLQYRREVLREKFLVARANYSYIGKTYWDLANKHEEDPYSLVNATLGLEADWWKVYLWGKNIFDQEYIRNGLMWGDTVVGAYGDPLTFGVTLQLEF